jgi:hypothetical protein
MATAAFKRAALTVPNECFTLPNHMSLSAIRPQAGLLADGHSIARKPSRAIATFHSLHEHPERARTGLECRVTRCS